MSYQPKNKRLRQVGEQQFEFSFRQPFSWRMKAAGLFRAGQVLLERSWEGANQLAGLEKKWGGESGQNILPGSEEAQIIADSQLYSEATLLFAIGFENLIKALWVGRNQEDLSGIGKLPSAFSDHDLLRLARDMDLHLTSEEEQALHVLSHYATWVGKYHLPKNKTQNAEHWEEGFPRAFMMEKHPGELAWPDGLQSLYGKLLSELESLPTIH